MKKTQSLKVSLFGLFILVVLISTLIVSLLGMQNTKDLLGAKITSDIENTSNQSASYFKEFFALKYELLNSIADETEICKLYEKPDEMCDYLAVRNKKYADILSIYMATAENVMIDSTYWQPDADYIATERDWYTAALAADGIAMIEPYVDSQTGNVIITISRKIEVQGSVVGVMAFDITGETLAQVISNTSTDLSYGFVVGDTGNILMHPDEAYAPKVDGTFSTMASIDGYKTAHEMLADSQGAIVSAKGPSGKDRMYNTKSIGDTGWNLYTSYDGDILENKLKTEMFVIIVVCVIAFLSSLMIVAKFYKRYISPIETVCDGLDRLSVGELGIKDDIEAMPVMSLEIARLQRSMCSVVDSLNGYITEIAAVLNQLSNGDFTAEITGEYQGEFTSIKQSLQKIIVALNSMLNSIYSASVEVDQGAQTVSGNSSMLLNGVSEQVGAIAQLTSTINTITVQVNENAQKSNDASEASQNVLAEVERSNEQMRALLQAIGDISTTSAEIEKINKTIQNIAFQTNILSLNAAVEAARAGDAGKGFAVVADEVRNLASKSADAANNTTELIKASIHSIENGVDLANQTAESLNSIVESVNSTSEVIQEVSTNSVDQAAALNSLTQIVGEINSVVISIEQTCRESVQTAQGLTGQSDILSDKVSTFKFK